MSSRNDPDNVVGRRYIDRFSEELRVLSVNIRNARFSRVPLQFARRGRGDENNLSPISSHNNNHYGLTQTGKLSNQQQQSLNPRYEEDRPKVLETVKEIMNELDMGFEIPESKDAEDPRMSTEVETPENQHKEFRRRTRIRLWLICLFIGFVVIVATTSYTASQANLNVNNDDDPTINVTSSPSPLLITSVPSPAPTQVPTNKPTICFLVFCS